MSNVYIDKGIKRTVTNTHMYTLVAGQQLSVSIVAHSREFPKLSLQEEDLSISINSVNY